MIRNFREASSYRPKDELFLRKAVTATQLVTMTRIDRPIDSDSDSEPSTRAYTARIPSMASAGRSKTQLKSKRKPKILFYTRPNAPPEALSQLKDVVEMVVIQPGDYETSKRRIQEAVEEHGDFEAFVVSCLSLNACFGTTTDSLSSS